MISSALDSGTSIWEKRSEISIAPRSRKVTPASPVIGHQIPWPDAGIAAGTNEQPDDVFRRVSARMRTSGILPFGRPPGLGNGRDFAVCFVFRVLLRICGVCQHHSGGRDVGDVELLGDD